jgi:hypothetical protein
MDSLDADLKLRTTRTSLFFCSLFYLFKPVTPL